MTKPPVGGRKPGDAGSCPQGRSCTPGSAPRSSGRRKPAEEFIHASKDHYISEDGGLFVRRGQGFVRLRMTVVDPTRCCEIQLEDDGTIRTTYRRRMSLREGNA